MATFFSIPTVRGAGSGLQRTTASVIAINVCAYFLRILATPCARTYIGDYPLQVCCRL